MMFTGIIEELGRVLSLNKDGGFGRLAVEAEVFKTSKIGDSISVNGACLTITEIEDKQACFDVSEETLSKTCLGRLRKGEKVNIERALKADARLGGHFVSGHIDCVGKIINKAEKDDNLIFEIKLEPEFKKYVVKKLICFSLTQYKKQYWICQGL